MITTRYLVVYIPAANAVAPPTVISSLFLSLNKTLKPPAKYLILDLVPR